MVLSPERIRITHEPLVYVWALAQKREEHDRIAVLILRKNGSESETQRVANYREKWTAWAKERPDVIVTILEVDAAVEIENFDNLFASNRHYDGLIVHAHGSTEFYRTGTNRLTYFLEAGSDSIRVDQLGHGGFPNWKEVLGIDNVGNVHATSCNPRDGLTYSDNNFEVSAGLANYWLRKKHQ